uniref:Uncharacterized protein n=1 Tax=Avena sativa TaxID=4498 RepID=A0ACD5YFP7_AVESA
MRKTKAAAQGTVCPPFPVIKREGGGDQRNSAPPVSSPERIDFALASDGATFVGVGSLRRTVSYDTRSGASSVGPELQHFKTGGTYVVPLGGRLYVLNRRLTRSDEGKPCGEDLLPADGAWRDLLEPPPDFRYPNQFQIKCQLTAYFTAGARIWVLAEERDTYSFPGGRPVQLGGHVPVVGP